MRNDTNKLCIAVCGPLPDAVELLDRRTDVEYTIFSNGHELRKCAEDDVPFDLMVIRSDDGAGIGPLSYQGCDGYCDVYLTADPLDNDSRDTLNELIDAMLEEKQFQLAQKERGASWNPRT